MASDEKNTVDVSNSTIPNVVQFAFLNYAIAGTKHTGKCKICLTTISEKLGTTSGFTRYMCYIIIICLLSCAVQFFI